MLNRESVQINLKHTLHKNKNPDFIIVGAPKAGTTSLYRYLSQHPKIFLPKIKEPMFFCGYEKPFQGPGSDWYNSHIVNESDDYLALFEDAHEDMITGEASTDYLSCPQAATRIKAWNPNVKIIIILRNPIDRAYSEHMSLIRKMRETKSFLQAVELEGQRIKEGYNPYFWHVKRGLYYEAVKNYLEIFDPDNVLVLFYDKLNQSSEYTIKKIFSFLGIEAINVNTSERFNISGRPKSKLLQRFLLSDRKFFTSKLIKTFIRNDELRARIRRSIMVSNLERSKIGKQEFVYLRNIFFEDINNLQDLLQVNLADWLADRRFE